MIIILGEKNVCPFLQHFKVFKMPTFRFFEDSNFVDTVAGTITLFTAVIKTTVFTASVAVCHSQSF